MAETFATTRELDALDRHVNQLETRLQSLDEHGTRGLGGLQVQLTEVAKDMGELGAELRRVRAGRWQAALAYVGALAPVYTWVVLQLLAHRG